MVCYSHCHRLPPLESERHLIPVGFGSSSTGPGAGVTIVSLRPTTSQPSRRPSTTPRQPTTSQRFPYCTPIHTDTSHSVFPTILHPIDDETHETTSLSLSLSFFLSLPFITGEWKNYFGWRSS
mmetsp:Transcript_13792/g.14904  ORF Transcript_13792/g.14904 Transcript_13792/m.14904 type:complete len:123 (-) Transcript_13792:250-618(-)